MKSITKHFIYFILVMLFITIAFRYSLSTLLENREFNMVWILSITYGALCFLDGWYFGKRDKVELPLFDVGFRFHLATYLICNLIGELWFLFGFASQYENIMVVHYTAIFWGIGILIHFFFYLRSRKHVINGLNKSEIFE